MQIETSQVHDSMIQKMFATTVTFSLLEAKFHNLLQKRKTIVSYEDYFCFLNSYLTGLEKEKAALN